MLALDSSCFCIDLIISFSHCLQSSSAKPSPGPINSFVPFHSIPNCKMQAKYKKQSSVAPVQLEAKGKWLSLPAFLGLV